MKPKRDDFVYVAYIIEPLKEKLIILRTELEKNR